MMENMCKVCNHYAIALITFSSEDQSQVEIEER